MNSITSINKFINCIFCPFLYDISPPPPYKKRCHDRRCNDCCRICAPILAAIGDNIYWYLLQRRYIHHKKLAHFIARRPRSTIHEAICGCYPHLCIHIFTVPTRALQFLQVTHCPDLPLCQVNDTNFLKKLRNRSFVFSAKFKP